MAKVSADYNGWLGFVRDLRDDDYKRFEHKLPKFTQCIGCLRTAPEVRVAPHSEEYGSSVATYKAYCVGLCNRCHGIIHCKARYPQVFLRYKRKLAEGEFIHSFDNMGEVFQTIFRCNRPFDGDISTLDNPSCGTWLDTLHYGTYTGVPKIATVLHGGQLAPDPTVYDADWRGPMIGEVVTVELATMMEFTRVGPGPYDVTTKILGERSNQGVQPSNRPKMTSKQRALF